MDRKSRNAHIKRLTLFIMSLLACLMQFSLPSFQKIFGVSVLYTIPVVVCISMFQGEIISMACALICGIIWDSISAQSICFHTVFLVVTAFIVSYSVQKRIRNFVISALIIELLVIFIHNILYWIFFILSESTSSATGALFKFYIPCAFVSSAVGILIYLFVSFVHKNFKEI